MTAFLGGVSNAPPLIACTSWPLELTVSAATHSQALPIRSTAPLPERPSGNDPTGLSAPGPPAAYARRGSPLFPPGQAVPPRPPAAAPRSEERPGGTARSSRSAPHHLKKKG